MTTKGMIVKDIEIKNIAETRLNLSDHVTKSLCKKFR